MSVIFTMVGPDCKPHIYAVPEGTSPETVSEKHGLGNETWEYCESEAEAMRRMSKDRTGQLEPF